MTATLSLRCGWSFERLDPDHSNPEKKSFVECQHCHRPFIAANWPGFCTRAGCESKEHSPLQVASPSPESDRRRIAIPFNSGPLNTISDVPLGISNGTVFFPNGTNQRIRFKNNSGETLRIPRVFGPVWLSPSITPGSDPAQPGIWRDQIHLKPGTSVEVTLHAHMLRAISADEFIPIYCDQGIQVVTFQDAWLVRVAQAVIAILALIHLVRFCQSIDTPDWSGAFGAAWTGGLLTGTILLLTPRILFGFLVRLGVKEIPAEHLLTGVTDLTTYGKVLLRLLFLVPVVILFTGILTPVMLLIAKTGHSLSPFFVCVGYLIILAYLTTLWASATGNNWLIAIWSQIKSIREMKKRTQATIQKLNTPG